MIYIIICLNIYLPSPEEEQKDREQVCNNIWKFTFVSVNLMYYNFFFIYISVKETNILVDKES